MTVKYTTFNNIPDSVYQSLNYPYEGKYYDIVLLSRTECSAYYEAAHECLKMINAAAEYVIRHRKLSEMGIPEFMHGIIEKTYFDADNNPHMLGRFDFAGGIDGVPIKLIEFNADTPFSIFETSTMQHVLCKAAGLDLDNNQYNTIFKELITFFKYMKEIYPDTANEIFFTNHEYDEDNLNTSILMEAAKEAGIQITHKHWTDIAVDDRYNIVGISGVAFDKSHIREQLFNITNITHLVKMVPWDLICTYDENSIERAKDIVKCLDLRPYTTISNPPYTMLYQSKALLSIVYDLFPESKYLLKSRIVCDTDDLKDKTMPPHVLKHVFGHEIQNIRAVENTKTTEYTDDYCDKVNGKYIWQELATFPKDEKNRCYQAEVFISRETPCGIGFRRSEPNKTTITTNDDLCGHIINYDC